jgi:uncharacterized delta-60 repeat protein
MKRFACVALLLLVTLGNAQVVEWLHRYPGYGSSGARDIAVDNAGNVYVTGWGYYPDRSRDCLTIKYDTMGDTAWVRHFDGGANYFDDGYALEIDNAGNVYVTGQCMVFSSDRDILTIKYNSAGVEQWVAVLSGTVGDDDEGHDIVVDDSGFVYVTGFTYSSPTSADWMTIKYDANGDTVWTARYNAPDSSADQATALALDDLGNVYVTGYTNTSPEWFDYLTIKYNAAGELQWMATYDGSANNADDKAYDIEYHGGYIYVTGESEDSTSESDYLTIKYDSMGDTVWTRRYDGLGAFYDVAVALTVDGAGNVYVTGESDGVTSAKDYATLKYTDAGNLEWTARYNGPANLGDEANAIAVDNAGNVYVTGRSYDTGTYTPEFDYLTVKYNAAGNEQWAARYDGTGHTQDEAHAVTVDNMGYVYVTGENTGNTSYEDVVTIKYTTTGIMEEAGFTIHDPGYNLTVSPNPFSGQTNIRFTMQDSRSTEQQLRNSNFAMRECTLGIYDAAGRLVKSFNPESCIMNHVSTIGWDGRDQFNRQLGSGVYFLRLTAGDHQETRQLLLIR